METIVDKALINIDQDQNGFIDFAEYVLGSKKQQAENETH